MSFIKKFLCALLILSSLTFAACSEGSEDTGNGQSGNNSAEPHVHSLTEYSEREAECGANGYLHHFKCDICGKAFADSDAQSEITGTEIIYTSGHSVVDNKCTVCGLSSDSKLYYRGYKSNSGEFQYAVVSGRGDSEAEHIIIPSFVKSGSNKITLERIDSGAFKDLSGIKSIFIPKTVKSVFQNAFKGCADLEVVIFEDESLCSSVSASMFADCPKLEYVKFGSGNNIKFLGSSAFKNCKRLTRVEFGESSVLEAFPEYCFDSCVSLTEVEIPEGIKKVSDKSFAGCVNIRSLVFNDKLTEIGDLAFSGCESLTELVIGKSATKIGSYAVSGCVSLENIFIPDSVRTVGSYAFTGCNKLTITLGKGVSTKNFNSYWNIENRPVENQE